jgi:hypothetical protein
MNNDTIEHEQGGKKQHRRRWIWYSLLALLLVALAGALGFLALNHRIAVALGADQRAAVRTVVCGSDVIEKYQKIYFPLDDGDSQAASDLAKSISSNPRSSEDPTCQTILFWFARDKNDTKTMETALTTIKRLHGEGAYVDSSLRDGAINYLEDAMKWNNDDQAVDGQ